MNSKISLWFSMVTLFSLTASAQVCTFAGSASLSIGTRTTVTAPTIGPFEPVLTFANGAMSTTCGNLMRGTTYTYWHTAKPSVSTGISNPDDRTSGTFTLPAMNASAISARVDLTCSCGLAGQNFSTVNAGSIIVPPTVTFIAVASTDPDFSDITADTVPVGKPILLAAPVSASLCTGETLTATLTGAGVTQTQTASGNTDCTGGNLSEGWQFTPTTTGTMKLVAEFQGARSNEVTLTVVNSASGAGGGGGTDASGGRGAGDGSKRGCTVAPGLLGFVALGVVRRRRERS